MAIGDIMTKSPAKKSVGNKLDFITGETRELFLPMVVLEGSLGSVSLSSTVETNLGYLPNIATNTGNILNQKINLIKGSPNYSRSFTYYAATDNVTIVVHTGTTVSGVKTVTETISYVNAAGGDFRVSNITYS